MQGKITECWLAEYACIKLVSRFKRILKRNFRNAFFRPKTYWFAAWKQFESGRLVLNEALDRTSWTPKLKVNFFVLLRVALLVLQAYFTLSALKKQRKFCRYVTCSQWKGEFWIQEVIRARLDTFLRLSAIYKLISRCCKLCNRKTGD